MREGQGKRGLKIRTMAKKGVRLPVMQFEGEVPTIAVQYLLAPFHQRDLIPIFFKSPYTPQKGITLESRSNQPHLQVEVLEDLDECGFEAGYLEAVSDAPNEPDRVNVGPDILEQAAYEGWFSANQSCRPPADEHRRQLGKNALGFVSEYLSKSSQRS
jgi:hypothetical protein